MNHWRRFLWLGLLIAASTQGQVVLPGQSPIIVGYQKKVEVHITGSTAAYSLNSNIADVMASNGLIEIMGKSPGTTNVVVVTSAGVQTLAVVVPQPPPNYPPGFIPPREGGVAEEGRYEVNYNSDPAQIINSIEFKRTQGDSFDRIQIVNSNLFSTTSDSVVGFPLASYQISRPQRDLTFVDQTVLNSPFTVDGYLVRGFHVRQGQWYFHTGFTTIATFQGLFLATDPEYLAGLSRVFRLNKENSLQANFFYFQNPRKDLSIASNGGVGSLVYSFRRRDRASFLAELAANRNLAFASRGNYDDKRTHLAGSFRIMPQRFASLAINNQHGTFGDLNFSRDLTNRLFASSSINSSDFNLINLRQNTFTGNALLGFKLNRHFTVTSGSTYSRFQSRVPVGPLIQTLNVPAGIDFSSRHFGTGFQYQRTITFDGAGGNDYAVNVRGSAHQFMLSGFFRHDVQAPTVTTIFSQLPGLQDLLDRAGIVANTPDELAQLLRNSALLATLGFTTPFTVNLAPVRDDVNASLTWMNQSYNHRRQVNLSYFDSNSQLITGSFRFTTETLSYAQRLNATNDLIASASLLRTSGGGSPKLRPVFSISFQHRFTSVPGFILPGRHGLIEGHVFRDDESTAQYKGQQPGIADVEVRLDDTRVTHTDSNGYYSFHHVPYGVHRVEAEFHSADPFFYTTDSPATADLNSVVDFGINFAKGQLFGFVLNDARKGISGVVVELSGAGIQRSITTDADGKFTFQGLGPGTFSITTQAGSYPNGYSLQGLEPQQATVEPGKPAKLEFTVKAIRVISGKITVYDTTALKPVPLPDAIVYVKELSISAKTGPNGAYILRNVPVGVYTLAVVYKGRETVRKVMVPAEPANIRDMDLDAGAK
ncbi:MAG TPA: carboxypeptidase regulatory-like domain-containing protein [Candidatus Angelobacter sp.]|nr:carboxypeptidase regulatory-like domain-containing protein [Candidatus Angelobacter sp.]